MVLLALLDSYLLSYNIFHEHVKCEMKTQVRNHHDLSQMQTTHRGYNTRGMRKSVLYFEISLN